VYLNGWTIFLMVENILEGFGKLWSWIAEGGISDHNPILL
jgi:hypothetical protein